MTEFETQLSRAVLDTHGADAMLTNDDTERSLRPGDAHCWRFKRSATGSCWRTTARPSTFAQAAVILSEDLLERRPWPSK